MIAHFGFIFWRRSNFEDATVHNVFVRILREKKQREKRGKGMYFRNLD
jgi:hypothetical protein